MLKSEPDRAARVLIVDDDPALRDMIRLILELAGFEVMEAVHGEDALRILGGMPEVPEVIVTDLMMPVMGGRELVDRLRQDPRTASVPILVLSANANPHEGLRGASRPNALMRKPFLPKALVDLVRSLEPAVTSIGESK